MCNCCDFGQRKAIERGGARGCAWVVVKDFYDSSDDEDYDDDPRFASYRQRADDKQYCKKCKPDGAKRYVEHFGLPRNQIRLQLCLNRRPLYTLPTAS